MSLDVMLIVITEAPLKPYLYDHINHENNKESAVEALQLVKETSKKFECFGWAFFGYVRRWVPSVR
jgi:hypothetical protein